MAEIHCTQARPLPFTNGTMQFVPDVSTDDLLAHLSCKIDQLTSMLALACAAIDSDNPPDRDFMYACVESAHECKALVDELQ